MNLETSSPWPPENQQISSEEKNRELFVGKKYQSYYKEHFDQMASQQTTSGFNVGALFLGPIWMVYRKMYAYAAIYTVCMMVLGIFIELIGIPEALDQMISIGVAVCLGIFGNKLYKTFVDKKIQKVTQTESSTYLESALRQEGGTNLAAALIIFIALTALLATVIYFELQGY